jgi:hypothetical protein
MERHHLFLAHLLLMVVAVAVVGQMLFLEARLLITLAVLVVAVVVLEELARLELMRQTEQQTLVVVVAVVEITMIPTVVLAVLAS